VFYHLFTITEELQTILIMTFHHTFNTLD